MFDSPYGITNEEWDVQLTLDDLVTQAKQIDAATNNPSMVWLIWHKPTDSHLIKEAMTNRNYKELQNIFWYKTKQYSSTQVSSYTNAVEMATVGFLPCREKVTWNVNLNPRQRHNFIEIPAVTTHAKHADGTIINPCEKPPELTRWFVSNHAIPGSHVLVIGGGAGGDVIGAALAGMNVVCVEKDERQFLALQKTLIQFVDSRKPPSDNPRPSKTEKSSLSSANSQPSDNQASSHGSDGEEDTCLGCNKQLFVDDREWCCVCEQEDEVWHLSCLIFYEEKYYCQEHDPRDPK